MRFLADENFPVPSTVELRQAGYDVAMVAQDSPGITDDKVMGRAVDEDRLLRTFDSDFGSMVYEGHGVHVSNVGILYFRLIPCSPTEPADLLLEILQNPSFSAIGYLTVIERRRLRQRPLSDRG